MSNATQIIRRNPKKNFADSVEAGGLVFFRGLTAIDRTKKIAGQTEDVLCQADALLSACGLTRKNIVSATIYMVDIRERETMNEVWGSWIDEESVPARATVGVQGLGTPDTLIEISFVASR